MVLESALEVVSRIEGNEYYGFFVSFVRSTNVFVSCKGAKSINDVKVFEGIKYIIGSIVLCFIYK